MPFSLPDLIRVLAAALFMMGPGLLLLEPLFGPARPRGAAGLALGLTLGLGAFGLFLWVNSFLGVPLWEYLWGWAALVSLGTVAVAVRQRRRRLKGLPAPTPAPGLPDFSGLPGRLLLGICAVAALVALTRGAYVSAGADAWEYLNRASMILRAGRLDAGSPYAAGLHDPYDPTFYGLIATLTKLSGVPADLAWRYFPVIATPLEIGVIALVTAAVVGSAAAGTAAAAVYTVFYGVFFLFRNSGHHQMLGDTLLLVSLAGLFLYRQEGRRRHLVMGALAGAAATTYHHFLVVQCALTIGLAGLILLLFDRSRPGGWRRPFAYTAAVGVALLPAVANLLGSHLKSVDPRAMDQFFKESYAPLLYFGTLYIPDPFQWFFRSFWHPIPALLLLVPLRRRLRKDPRAAVLAALLVAPVLVVMNPLVFPLVAKSIGLQVSTRLLNMTTYPSVLLLGWLVAEWWKARRLARGGATPAAAEILPAQPPFETKLTLACVVLSLLCVLPQTLIRAQGDYYGSAFRREWSESPPAWREALLELKRRATAGQIVLSDEVTAFSIPTFAPLYIVANQRADFAFQTPDAPRRKAATACVLDPVAPPDSTLAALLEFQVDWIVINRRFTTPLTLEKLDYLAALTGGLKRAFERQGLVVYAVQRAALVGPPPPAGPLLERLLVSPDLFTSFTAPGSGIAWDARLGAGGVSGPDRVSPGDTLFVTFYFAKRADAARSRFNAKILKEALYGDRDRRILRQVRSSILSINEVILFPRVLIDRDFQRHAVPVGSILPDPYALPVPADLKLGSYAIYLSPDGFPTDGALGLKVGSVEVVPRRRGGSAPTP